MSIKQVNKAIAKVLGNTSIKVAWIRDEGYSINDPDATFYLGICHEFNSMSVKYDCTDFVKQCTGCSRETAEQVARLVSQVEE